MHVGGFVHIESPRAVGDQVTRHPEALCFSLVSRSPMTAEREMKVDARGHRQHVGATGVMVGDDGDARLGFKLAEPDRVLKITVDHNESLKTIPEALVGVLDRLIEIWQRPTPAPPRRAP